MTIEFGIPAFKMLIETNLRCLFDDLGIRASQEKKNEYVKKIMIDVDKLIAWLTSSHEEQVKKTKAEEETKYNKLFTGNKFLEELIARTVSEKLKVNVSAENTSVKVKLDWDGKQISEAGDELGLDDYVRRQNPLES